MRDATSERCEILSKVRTLNTTDSGGVKEFPEKVELVAVMESARVGQGRVMDKRVDLIDIIGRTGGVHARPEDFERALDLWCHKAEKEGWSVSVLDHERDSGIDGRCGTVEVEGLRYEVRYGPRTRTTLIDDSTGEDIERPAFAYAVWAEPVVLEIFLVEE
ncbi:hypothetical protein [Micromonospora sp. NPDC051006]|uniref:hypothetical protein n=1 Tax=Micromonospora sp. NPDC051006 TaxID=3364283 RepID=UPI0037B12C8C